MYILGLTGSIGMGKTTAASMFRRYGVPVYDADAAVHQLMRSDSLVIKQIKKLFPNAVENENIDRNALGSIVYKNRKALAALELILHPLVRAMQIEFLRQKGKARESLVVLDIPLLFENKVDKFCDTVAVVSAPSYLQKIRVLGRPYMTPERFEKIIENQLSNTEKIKQAEFIIQTGIGRNHSLLNIINIIGIVRERRGKCWPI